MDNLVKGIHHITALASDPQKNLDFYAGILGLRLLKKTVNFDAPDVYHLYYGNEIGTPGTILTFFPFVDITKGKKGKGQLTTISFSIPENSIPYWIKRFNNFQIKYIKEETRFDNETVVSFEDYDGLNLKLIANKIDERPSFTYGNIPIEHAIKGFYSATLTEESIEKTSGLLTQYMDYHLMDKKENRYRFSVSQKAGEFIDILCSPDSLQGTGGSGTVHHIAFATPDDSTQLEARNKLEKGNLNITPVLDRQYFHSIYFREPGGVLFEIATIPPGFGIDEKPDHLGELLKLPPWLEKYRNQIEKRLSPIKLDLKRFKD